MTYRTVPSLGPAFGVTALHVLEATSDLDDEHALEAAIESTSANARVMGVPPQAGPAERRTVLRARASIESGGKPPAEAGGWIQIASPNDAYQVAKPGE